MEDTYSAIVHSSNYGCIHYFCSLALPLAFVGVEIAKLHYLLPNPSIRRSSANRHKIHYLFESSKHLLDCVCKSNLDSALAMFANRAFALAKVHTSIATCDPVAASCSIFFLLYGLVESCVSSTMRSCVSRERSWHSHGTPSERMSDACDARSYVLLLCWSRLLWKLACRRLVSQLSVE